MKFKFFYILFFITSLFYPFAYVVGPISVRHIMAAIMLVWLIVIKEFRMDKFLWGYSFFLLLYGLSSILTGFGGEFLSKLLGTYLACVTFYMSTKTMIVKYNALKWIIVAILAVACIDALVTIGQFFNNPIAKGVTLLLRVQNVDDILWEKYDSGGALGGVAAAGLLGDIQNGYFLSAAVILSLLNISSGKIRIINWLLFVYLFFALFVTQERSGLLFGAFSCFIYIVINTRFHRRNIIIILAAIIFALYYGGSYIGNLIDIDNTRYGMLGSDMGGRSELSQGVWQYLLHNPLGGALEFFAEGNREPHNFMANSFLYGGIFGGVILMAIILWQMIVVFRIVYNSAFKIPYSSVLVVFSLMYFAYTGSSAFHNLSLPTGCEMFFIIWGVVSALYRRENFSRPSISINPRNHGV